MLGMLGACPHRDREETLKNQRAVLVPDPPKIAQRRLREESPAPPHPAVSSALLTAPLWPAAISAGNFAGEPEMRVEKASGE